MEWWNTYKLAAATLIRRVGSFIYDDDDDDTSLALYMFRIFRCFYFDEILIDSDLRIMRSEIRFNSGMSLLTAQYRTTLLMI